MTISSLLDSQARYTREARTFYNDSRSNHLKGLGASTKSAESCPQMRMTDCLGGFVQDK